MYNTTTSAPYCDLEHFRRTYAQVHGPLSFLVCVFGSVTNILNICVLTTKEMRWPTNLILTGLAVADLLVMLEYIPFTYNYYLSDRKQSASMSYNWAAFTMFHAIFTQVLHFISCCLTIVLAVWRYVIITSPHQTRALCTMRRTLYVVLLTYALCPVVCCPIYLALRIGAYNHTASANGRLIDRADVAAFAGPLENRTVYYLTYKEDYKIVSFWIYGVVLKFIPCVLLTHLSHRLIAVLVETKKRRLALMNTTLPMNDANSSSMKPILCKKRERDNKQADRTSSMLVAVLLLFLITEFPQAILGLLSAIIGNDFETQCYIPLGDVMDILALTNSAINFILYCTMSRQFRVTFREMFRPKILKSFQPLNQHSTIERINGEKTQLSQV